MRRILIWQSLVILLLNINTFTHANQQNDIIIDSGQSENEVIPFKFQEDKAVVKKPKKKSVLAISENDVIWEFSKNGEYIDLLIRKKKFIKSVLLTNMYYGDKAGDYGSTPYGLRTRLYNRVNGNEYRLVNRKMVGKARGVYFLVDSTPEKHYLFGLAFRIRIPKMVEYGYKNTGSTYGIIAISRGVILNLRTYTRKYADNRGGFYNNMVQVEFSDKPEKSSSNPTITKVREFWENGYKVLQVRYFSRVEYVRHFLIRDVHVAKAFRRISFVSRRNKGHKTAVLISANYKKGYGVSINAFIYLKDEGHEKEYDIAAVDQQNRTSSSYFTVIIPQNGKSSTWDPDDRKSPDSKEDLFYEHSIKPSEEDFFDTK